MAKVYYLNFKTYSKTMNSLLVDIYSKEDLIYDAPSKIKLKNSIKIQGFTQKNRSIFYLGKREHILKNLKNQPEILHVAMQKQKKNFYEEIFRKINKFLMDTIATEFIFTQEFFCLSEAQNTLVFKGIFNASLDLLLQATITQIQGLNDFYAVLLVILINEKHAKFYNSKGLTVLDSYFQQINQIAWPHFIMLFDRHFQSLDKLPVEDYVQLEKEFYSKIILLRYIDFSIGLYKINYFANNNTMLSVRLSMMKNSMIKLLKKVSLTKGEKWEQMMYIISSIDYILSYYLNQNVVNEKDLRFFEEELRRQIDAFILFSMQDIFGNLVDFVRKYAEDDNIKELGISTDQKTQQKQPKNNKQPLNKNLIQLINQDFSEQWHSKIEQFKSKCIKQLKGTSSFKLILKKFLNNLLAYYNIFYKFVKKNYSEFIKQMQPVPVIMKEVNNQLRNKQN